MIGRNGAGKSTLLKILTRITTPTSGHAELRGRVGSLLEVGTGFHPELTGRENVFLNGSVLGMKRREIQGKFDEIVEFSGVEQFIDTPVKRYSSGMSVRLAFAVAAHLEPEILLVDEVLAVGDAEFQRRCLGSDGRSQPVRSDGGLRLSPDAGRYPALRSRRPPRERERRPRRAERRRRAHYLQLVEGSSSERIWPDFDTAPGDDLVRLLAVRVVDGRARSLVRAWTFDDPSGSRSRSECCARGSAPSFPRSRCIDARRNVAFNALDTSPTLGRASLLPVSTRRRRGSPEIS